MAFGTLRQRKQQTLSWKLRCVMGARCNIYPRERDIPEHIKQKLRDVDTELLLIEHQLRDALRNIK